MWTNQWLENNRPVCVEALRIFLGIGLILKGIHFIIRPEQAEAFIAKASLPFWGFLSIHLIIILHIAGGTLLVLGLLTRIAALIQIPILLGALFLIHLDQGLFSQEQSLEYVILVLFLLVFFVLYGGGIFSIDQAIRNRMAGK
jgi:uncharacterized membrane protein YphA (DoxX/SURF4 family)